MSKPVTYDLFPRIAYFLESPQDVLSLMQVDRSARAESRKVIYDKYQECFGRFNAEMDSLELQRACILHLRSVGKVVDRCYTSLRIMRPSMETGRNLQREYERMIDLLDQTESTTIMQLKNRALALGFTQESMSQHLQLCFGVGKREYVQWYGQNPFKLNLCEAINECCEKLSATLGLFSLDGQQYTIKAAPEQHDSDRAQNMLLNTLTGSVIISVENQQGKTEINFPVALGRCPLASSQIERDLVERPGEIRPVKKESRWVLDVRDIDFRPLDAPFDYDQKLGRKVIQLLIEMAKQDSRISEIRVTCCRVDPWVFAAAGFRDLYARSQGESRKQVQERWWGRSIQEILEFRQNPANSLFPTEDEGGRKLVFKMDSFKAEQVYFKRGGESESWEQIIAQNPLLSPQVGVLPEFWVKEQPKAS